ncbi:MAG: penicillin-insensitive murein endopeptidase [Pseudomonadota bacterium]
MRASALILAGALALGAATSAHSEAAKFLFGAKKSPAALAPAAFGSYAKGCLARGTELPETGPGWQAMRLSRNRNWGHPEMIDFIKRLSVEAQAIGWPRLYVGDIAQPRGGPMRSGHRSHQIGLDADIWLRKPVEKLLTRNQREKISSHVVTNRGGTGVNRFWTPSHHQVLKAAASDPMVARIFVHAAIKQEMCLNEPVGFQRTWLRKIRPWYGHNAHFHVRLNCPFGSPGCVEQDPIPPGDGCDETLDWWFSEEARNPKPQPGQKPKPRRALTLADLPLDCTTVLRK